MGAFRYWYNVFSKILLSGREADTVFDEVGN